MTSRLKVSRAGVELIKSFEGLRQTASRLPDGRWTIGYGHTFSAREGARVTPEDAESLLRFDLLPIVDGINNAVQFPLNQNQFDSLVSFVFNIGLENFLQSTVLKRLNEGRIEDAAAAMDSWRSAEFNGQTYVLAPLIRRRAAEKALFLTPLELPTSAPSMKVRAVENDQDLPVLEAHLEELNGLSHPLSAPQAPVAAFMPEAVTPSVTAPVMATPVSAAPVAHVAETGIEEVRAKPVIVRMAEMTPTPEPLPWPVQPPAVEADPTLPVMSAAVKAALDLAQREAELRAAQNARMAADAEIKRQREAELLAQQVAETQKLESQRLEMQRLEQERQEQARLEAMKTEAARLESERLEAERLEAEAQRREAEQREALRLEAERKETQRLEAIRQQQQAEQASREQAARLEAEPQAVLKLSPEATPVDEGARRAEEQRKAEAAAALMRLYSPYGAQHIAHNAPPLPMAPQPTPVVTPVQPVAAPIPEPEPPVGFAIKPTTTQGLVIDTPDPSMKSPSAIVPPTVIAFPRPAVADEPMPFIAQTAVPPAETVVEVPRPHPVSPGSDTQAPPEFPRPFDQAATVAAISEMPQWPPQRAPEISADTRPDSQPRFQAPSLAAIPSIEERMKERPLDWRVPNPAPEPDPRSGIAAHTAAFDEAHAEWMDEHGRILAEHAHVPHEDPSVWSMFKKTYGWLIPSVFGLIALGGAAGALYRSRDPNVQRGGYFSQFSDLTLYLGIFGLVLSCISVFMIMKRLGGVRD